MNIHPLFVHFPIAFLVIYSIFEFVCIKKLTKNSTWVSLKAILLFLGILGAVAAGITGKLTEHLVANHQLVSLHSSVNQLATGMFVLIGFPYVLKILKQSRYGKYLKSLGISWKLAIWYEHIVLDTPLLYVLVLAGLILILIGGALGGIIVYGVGMDPFTSFVAALFHIN